MAKYLASARRRRMMSVAEQIGAAEPPWLERAESTAWRLGDGARLLRERPSVEAERWSVDVTAA
jgi:hypothetical protein